MANFTPLSAAVGGALIGLAAALLMLSTGRIAGISGIVGGLIGWNVPDRDWRIAFIVGLILAPLSGSLVGYAVAEPQMPASWAVIVIAGLLVGFGTRLGGGCTSGHGVCGVARLSLRSLVATTVFMAVAIVVVAITRHVLGGGSHVDARRIDRRLRVRLGTAHLRHDAARQGARLPGRVRRLGPEPARCDGRGTCSRQRRLCDRAAKGAIVRGAQHVAGEGHDRRTTHPWRHNVRRRMGPHRPLSGPGDREPRNAFTTSRRVRRRHDRMHGAPQCVAKARGGTASHGDRQHGRIAKPAQSEGAGRDAPYSRLWKSKTSTK